MIEVLLGWIEDLKVLVIAAISLMGMGLVVFTWGRTKSGAAVVGVIAVGVLAIVGAANMGTIAGWVGSDLNTHATDNNMETVCTEWGSCQNGG